MAINYIDNTDAYGLRNLPSIGGLPEMESVDPTTVPVWEQNALGNWKGKIDDSQCAQFNGGSINRKIQLVGWKNGKEEERLEVGREAMPATFGLKFEDSAPRLASRLTLMPAVAGVAGDVIDRNYTAAVSQAALLFAGESSNQRFSAAGLRAVKMLANKFPDVSAVCLRLAQVWAYYAYVESAGTIGGVHGTMPTPKHIGSVDQMNALLVSANSGTHVMFIDLRFNDNDAASMLSALRMAVGADSLLATGNIVLPSILQKLIPLPPVTVAFSGDGSADRYSTETSATEIWSAALHWACAIGCEELLCEYVETVCSLMYSTKTGCDEVFSWGHICMAVPPLNMSHYALTPICISAEQIGEQKHIAQPNLYRIAVASVVRNQMLSCSFNWLMWFHNVGASASLPHTVRKSAAWMKRVIGRSSHGGTQAWGSLMACVKNMTGSVGISRSFGSIRPLMPKTKDLRAMGRSAMAKGTQWEELVDVLDSVPSDVLGQLTNPKKSTVLLQPRSNYALSKIAGASSAACLLAVHEAGGEMRLAHRNAGQYNWHINKIEVLMNYRGGVHDYAAVRPFNEDRVSYKWSFSLPSAVESLKLYQGSEIRSGYSWFLTGVPSTGDSESVFGDGFSDDDSMVRGERPIADTIHETPKTESPKQFIDSGIDKGPSSSRPPEDKVGTGPKEEATAATRALCERIFSDVTPGVYHDAANSLLKAEGRRINQKGRTDVEFWGPYFSGPGTMLKDVSPALAVKHVEPERRGLVLRSLGAMLQRCLLYIPRSSDTEAYASAAARAFNSADALEVCSAMNAEELEKQGYDLDEMMKLDENIVADALGKGMPLNMFSARNASGIDTIEVSQSETQAKEDEGWYVNKDQGRAQSGKVLMHRPRQGVTPARKEWMAVLDENVINKLKESVDAIVEKAEGLGEDVGISSTPLQKVSDAVHASEVDQTVVDREGMPIAEAGVELAAQDFGDSPSTSKQSQREQGDLPPAITRGVELGTMDQPEAAQEPEQAETGEMHLVDFTDV